MVVPNSQAAVAALIVAGLILLGAGCLAAAIVDNKLAALAFGAVGVVIGSLATALNAPTGIASVIAQARKAPETETDDAK